MFSQQNCQDYGQKCTNCLDICQNSAAEIFGKLSHADMYPLVRNAFSWIFIEKVKFLIEMEGLRYQNHGLCHLYIGIGRRVMNQDDYKTAPSFSGLPLPEVVILLPEPVGPRQHSSSQNILIRCQRLAETEGRIQLKESVDHRVTPTSKGSKSHIHQLLPTCSLFVYLYSSDNNNITNINK